MRPFWGLMLLLACKSSPPEANDTKPTATTTTSSAEPPAKKPAELAWTMPSGWSAEPTAGMRKATYRIAKAAGDKEDATLAVIAAGGSVESNVARWKTQFDQPHDIQRTEGKVGDLQVTTVEIHGTYTGGGVMVGESPDPRPGWALVGAIVPTQDQAYFFKMLGPDKTVAAARHDFQALVDSIHSK